MPGRPTDLDETLAADGQTAAVYHPGGTGSFSAVGTFGTGTVQLQAQFLANGSFVPVTGTALTADDVITYSLPQCVIRLDLAGSATPSIVLSIRAHHDV